jgi:hypothetical protein
VTTLEAILLTAGCSAVVGLLTQGSMLWARVAIERAQAKAKAERDRDEHLLVSKLSLEHMSERIDALAGEVARWRDVVLELPCRNPGGCAPQDDTDHAA